MANIKQVKIRGIVPFDYYNDDIVAKMFAFITSPSSGLEVTWKSAGYQPSQYGGQTAMYEFTVTGQEAISWEWIDACVINGIAALGGKILENNIVDIEE